MRHALEQWMGETIFYSGRVLEWEERSGQIWMLIKNVVIGKHEPHLTGEEIEKRSEKLDHLWVALWEGANIDKVERLVRARMCGTPYKYRRLDGTEDYALSSEMFIDTGGLIDDWKKALKQKQWDAALEISQVIIEAWEHYRIPVCNQKQSTNEVIRLQREAVRRLTLAIEHTNKRKRKKLPLRPKFGFGQ